MRVLQSRRLLALLTAVALTVAAVVGAFAWMQRDSGCTSSDEELHAAALVNCEVVSEASVELGLKGARLSGASITREEYLDALIEEELLFQEAVKQGFTPSDDEVEEAIALSRSLANWEEFVEVWEALGEDVPDEEEYWSSPERRVGMARSIAVGRYRDHIGSTHDGPPELEAVVQIEIDRLRETADIEIISPDSP